MADWLTLAMVHILIGVEADALGTISYNAGDDTVQAMLLIAYLIYLVVGMLTAMNKLAGLQHNLIITIVNIAGLIIAALFIIIGVAIDGDNSGNNLNPYKATLVISACLMGLLGALFLLLNLLCGGGKRTNPGD